MRLRRILPSLLRRAASAACLGAAVAGCTDLDLTNPNAKAEETFWQTDADALSAVNATYAGLMQNGTYGRWLVFANDLRSDIGMVESPWTDLSNFAKFSFASYDFEVNREIWQHHYQTIFRANQVIQRVPEIEMDPALRDRIVGEAKFIRALLHFNLLVLYENIPLVTTPPLPTDRPTTVPPDQVWALIEQDLNEARAVLPDAYTGADVGRATKGAATALLGKALLQQGKWDQAAGALQEVIASGRYSLIPNYADNFTNANENNAESLFEVQFGDRTQLSQGVRGLNIARMIGPCGPSFCDGRPTRWYFEQFLAEEAATGVHDVRLDATMFYEHPGEDVYGEPFVNPGRHAQRTADRIWFKKWGEYYIRNGDQDWDAAINFRVIRYADVLLMQAEALNEQGNPVAAAGFVNQVRARVDLPPLPAGLSTAGMRDRILRERMFELGLEASRYTDLRRHDLLSPALAARDPEFNFFTEGKSELLPIPQTERDLNPNVTQNPGW